jgi:hypothetical protein
MGNINPIQLKKIIKRPILGLKEGKLNLGELLLASEMELSESSLLVKRMVPSAGNPEVMVERVELDFNLIQQKLNFQLMKEKNLI